MTVRVKDPLNDGQIYTQHRKTASDASPDIVQDPGARRSPPLPFAMMLSSRVLARLNPDGAVVPGLNINRDRANLGSINDGLDVRVVRLGRRSEGPTCEY